MMPLQSVGNSGKRSLSYIVGGSNISTTSRKQSGYDNPGFRRGTSLTSSINLTADNLDFVIDSGKSSKYFYNFEAGLTIIRISILLKLL